MQLSHMEKALPKTGLNKLFCSVLHDISNLIFLHFQKISFFHVKSETKNSRLIISKAIQVQVVKILPTELKCACNTGEFI